MDLEVYRRYSQMARGLEKAELVFKNGRVFSSGTGEFIDGDVAVADGIVIGIGTYEGETEIDLDGKVICPGFIDSHLHLESTLVTPGELVRQAAQRWRTPLPRRCLLRKEKRPCLLSLRCLSRRVQRLRPLPGRCLLLKAVHLRKLSEPSPLSGLRARRGNLPCLLSRRQPRTRRQRRTCPMICPAKRVLRNRILIHKPSSGWGPRLCAAPFRYQEEAYDVARHPRHHHHQR